MKIDTKKKEDNIRSPTEQAYRTAKVAGKVAKMPRDLAIITKPEYQNALKCHRKDGNLRENAYLLQIADTEILSFEDGIAMLFERSLQDQDADFIDYSTKERIDEIDVTFLMSIFTVIYMNLSKAIADITSEEELKEKLTSFCVDIYIPDLIKFMGKSCRYSKEELTNICDKISRYHNVIGITEKVIGGQIYSDGYMLLVTLAIKESTNTITIMSPYMNMLIYKLFKISIDKDKKGVPKVNKNGDVKTLPTLSFQDSRLASAKNKKAVEIVCVVVALVEQTGSKGTPHIRVSKLIEQCPSLIYSLENTKSDSNKTKLLRRCFLTAWEYIVKYTDLLEKYVDFQLPSETPTINTLDMVLTFRHSGKVKKK